MSDALANKKVRKLYITILSSSQVLVATQDGTTKAVAATPVRPSCVQGVVCTGDTENRTTVQIYSGSLMHGCLKPIGFTLFQFRDISERQFRSGNSDTREVVVSVNGNTDEADEAVRLFAQQIPALTGLAHWLRQPELAPGWNAAAPHVRVDATDFMCVVSQAKTEKGRNQAVFNWC